MTRLTLRDVLVLLGHATFFLAMSVAFFVGLAMVAAIWDLLP